MILPARFGKMITSRYHGDDLKIWTTTGDVMLEQGDFVRDGRKFHRIDHQGGALMIDLRHDSWEQFDEIHIEMLDDQSGVYIRGAFINFIHINDEDVYLEKRRCRFGFWKNANNTDNPIRHSWLLSYYQDHWQYETQHSGKTIFV